MFIVFHGLNLNSNILTVVTTTLTEASFRFLEADRQVRVCVTKDLETAEEFNVTVRTVDGTATRKIVLFFCIKN